MSKPYQFFVAGTDTGVGKTLVATAILQAATRVGLTTAAVKPIAAGCDENGENEDALALMEAMSLDLAYQQVNPVALEEAIAPHIAAHFLAQRCKFKGSDVGCLAYLLLIGQHDGG